MPYVGKKPADIIATAVDSTTGDFSGNVTAGGTLAVTGIGTFTDDIIIGDGKTIGSASDVDAITIASNGQLTLTQTLIGTALDISGDIDVDGTTNLDVVDIDGALTQDGGAVFNEDSADVDFRVESNVNTHGIFLDAGNEKVGIFTSNPNDYYADDLVLTAADEGGITIKGGTGHANFVAFADGTSGNAAYRGFLNYDHAIDSLYLGVAGEAHFTINNAHILTMDKQPAFQVRKSADQNNVSASDSATTVTFDVEVFDNNADFASNTFTAPVTGKYFLSINVYLASIDTDAGYILIGIKTSNRDYYRIVDPNFSADLSYYGMNFSVLADLDASDTAYIFWQSNGGAAQVDIVAANGTQFQGHLLS